MPNDKRSEFEVWFEADAMPLEADWFTRDPDDPERYAHQSTQDAWKGWQAHAASVAPARCKHDVWAADHCYKCEAESLSGLCPRCLTGKDDNGDRDCSTCARWNDRLLAEHLRRLAGSLRASLLRHGVKI